MRRTQQGKSYYTGQHALHYNDTWRTFLQKTLAVKHLLAPGGQIVIEDYILRGFPFPWRMFEWIIKLYDPQHIRLYTLEEVQVLCQNAGILLEDARSFPIDLFCQGWVFRGQ